MNASPANLNPAAATQHQSAAGKPLDTSQDTPFSQVLSSEMAQGRRDGAVQKADKPDPVPEDGVKAIVPESVDAPQDGKIDNTPIAAAFDMLRAEATPVSPGNFFAMPSLSAQAQTQADSDVSATDDAMPHRAATLMGNPQIKREDQQNSPASEAPQTAKAPLAAVQKKLDPAQQGKIAADFSGILTAAHQSDTTKTTTEPLASLMPLPAMRTTPTVPIEAPTPTSGAAANTLSPSVGTTAWGQALGEKVVWMAAGTQQTASLTLNPPNLGPLQIVVNVTNDQATASFFSAQPEVRQALEAAFPRLREMMSEAGIQLGQATVSAETPQQHASDQRSQRLSPSLSGAEDSASLDLPSIQTTALRSGRGLVDTFA